MTAQQIARGGPGQRSNPVLRTPRINLPPAGRTRVAHGLTAAAATGNALVLQTCKDCAATQYPPREACGACLSDRLQWREQAGGGALVAQTTVRHSNHLYFRERLPWRVGTIHLDAGPAVVAFLTDSVPAAPARVRVSLHLDRAGEAVLVAQPESEYAMHGEEKLQRETGCNPKGRNVLVSDGKSAVGQALVRALVGAGCATVWVGHAEPWKKHLALDGIATLPGVHLVPLDLTDARAVAELGGELGGKVDIVVSNAEVNRTQSVASRRGTDVARAEMDINYFGLLRLAQAFAPALQARAADGARHAVAWVNLLSIFALNHYPTHGTYSASKAAALSIAQGLRAQMLPHGIRVLNLFPGPVDDEWNQNLPPPKLSPAALASATLDALMRGVEDVYPGDVAQEWLARWRENPKALEREVAHGSL
ncbi:MAG: SDR family NAD(P)-dependent oxidoreductase [Burkholderiales bacterium]|nr:SDR family NAD(P)-dependent oxidoreductase [Burkholderiales bacterium]